MGFGFARARQPAFRLPERGGDVGAAGTALNIDGWGWRGVQGLALLVAGGETPAPAKDKRCVKAA